MENARESVPIECGNRCRGPARQTLNPVGNFGTVEGENPTPYGILALWAVNSLSIVYWEGMSIETVHYRPHSLPKQGDNVLGSICPSAHSL